MKAILAVSVTLLGSQSFAQENPVSGRMICEVLTSEFVPASEDFAISNDIRGEGFLSGTTFFIDYTHDLETGINIFLGEPNRANVLIDEPFPASSFKGVSRITNIAEYRTTYSEVSFGEYSMSYKGSDQFYLRKCSSEEWKGFYVQTYVSGHYKQVASLNCRTFVDAIDEVLARLKLSN